MHPDPATIRRYRDALAGLDLPAAFADVALVQANLTTALAYAGGTPLRLATKSVRCPALIELALDSPDVIGLMCAAPHEAAWWARRRPGTDLMVAYPSVEPAALADCAGLVAEGAVIRFMADSPAHLRVLAEHGRQAGTVLEACIDLDMSVDLGGRRGIRFGVHRSPVRSPRDAVSLVEEARSLGSVRIVALMGYEAQLAGLQDRPLGGPPGRAALVRGLKRGTAGAVRRRRRQVVKALRGCGIDLAFVNGGGSGSVPSTASEPTVTEVAVGSALLCPTLFDGYDEVAYQPAAGFALRVTRIPTDGVVTCYGGGWIASGAAGGDRLPRPWVPAGASLISTEGAGEVQTPIRLPDDVRLDIGDVVLLRHAKAGELCDRTDTLHLIHPDGTVQAAPTYRGSGLVLS
ncbi:amino acid deaminase/aldolase [soil metagenome]